MPAATKPSAAEADGVIDLDARKAARQEKQGGPRKVKFGGKVWEFKNELPMRVMENFTDGDLTGAFEQILEHSEDADSFLESGDLSQADFQELMSAVYGLSLPSS